MKRRNPVILVGGGPAAIACLAALRHRGDEREILLVDEAAEHLNQPRLHETVGESSLEKVQVPFDEIVGSYHAQFVQARCEVKEADLVRAEESGTLPIAGEAVAFSQLLVATGSSPVASPGPGGLTLSQLRSTPPRITAGRPRRIVGGGASAVQYAAELAELEDVELVTDQSRLLADLPEKVSAHAADFLADRGVRIKYGHRVDTVQDDQLWLAGVRPSPSLTANVLGQVQSRGRSLQRIFAAGDCCHYAGSGLNALSAQAAIRKGKLAGRNMRRQFQARFLLPYDYGERGYIVSLGSDDSAGWLGSRSNVVTGSTALAARRAIEEQYDLLLRGIDLFV